MQTINRWHKSPYSGHAYEAFFISRSREFRRYKWSMYLMNHAALIIQHNFFKWKARGGKKAPRVNLKPVPLNEPKHSYNAEV